MKRLLIMAFLLTGCATADVQQETPASLNQTIAERKAAELRVAQDHQLSVERYVKTTSALEFMAWVVAIGVPMVGLFGTATFIWNYHLQQEYKRSLIQIDGSKPLIVSRNRGSMTIHDPNLNITPETTISPDGAWSEEATEFNMNIARAAQMTQAMRHAPAAAAKAIQNQVEATSEYTIKTPARKFLLVDRAGEHDLQ